MSTLHIINTPQSKSDLSLHLQRFNSSDAVIFIQDGCYTLLNQAVFSVLNASIVKAYAIEADLNARAVTRQNPLAFDAIDYDAFVDLTLSHHKTISW
ncbi:MAG: sulfurtransferase complex subunit TusB [Algicola sp.]|nr:sulfurtransferase complex subunit TusB [Algicola sp.]